MNFRNTVTSTSSDKIRGLNVSPKSSINFEDQPFVRSFQVRNDDLDDEDALLDLSYARPYDFVPGEPLSDNQSRYGCSDVSPFGNQGSCQLIQETVDELTSPVTPTADDVFEKQFPDIPLTPPSRYGDHVTITSLTLSGSDVAPRGNSGLAVTCSSRNVGSYRKRMSGRAVQAATSGKRESSCATRDALSSKLRQSEDSNFSDPLDGSDGNHTSQRARSRQRRSFFRAVANNDDSLLSLRRGASKVKVPSVFRVAATAMSSRFATRARKAGIIDLTVPFVEGMRLAKEVIQNDYQGTVSFETPTELRMQIVISSPGKSTLCNIFISGERKSFGCRLWVRRSVADSVRGGNDDFDKFSLNLHQQLVQLVQLCSPDN